VKKVNIKEAAQAISDGSIVCLEKGDRRFLLMDAQNEMTIGHLRKSGIIRSEFDLAVWAGTDAMINKLVEEVPAIAWDIFDSSEGNLVLILQGARSISKSAMLSDGSVGIRKIIDSDELQLTRMSSCPILSVVCSDTRDEGVQTLDNLSGVEYLLTLTPDLNGRGSRPFSIIYLGADNTVKVIRE
jgi:hypothetical protein